MADPTDIEIKIKTEADTAGADEAKKSIFAIEEATKKVERQADVVAVKEKARAAVSAANAAEEIRLLGNIADATQRVAAGQAVQQIAAIGKEFKGISTEVDFAIGGVEKFSSTLASSGNVAVAIAATTVYAVGGVVKAYLDAEKQRKEIAKAEAETLKEHAILRAQFAAQIRSENLATYFRAELAALEDQEAALGRIARIKASERELAAAQQAASGQAAVAAGASPDAVAATNLAAGTASKLAELQQTLTTGQATVDAANEKASDLTRKSNDLNEQTGALGKEVVAAQEAAVTAAVDAQQAAKKAALDFLEVQTVTRNEIESVVTASVAEAKNTSAAWLAAITATAQQERTALDAEVKRLGPAASSNAKAGLEVLSKILADGVIKPDELARIGEAMAQIRGSREASDKLVKEGLDALAKADTAFITVITPTVTRLGETLTAIQQVQGTQEQQQFQIQEIQRNLETVARMLTSSQSSR